MPNELTPEQEMQKAFDELTSDPVEPENAEEIPATEEEVVEEETPVQEEVIPVREEEPTEDYRALFEKSQKEARDWKGRLEKEQRERKELEEKLKREAEPKQDESIKKAEKLISEFESDFPDMARPIFLMIQREVGKAVAYVLDQMKNEVSPLAQTVEVTAKSRHFQMIESAHPDVSKIVSTGALDKWIESKPDYIRPRLIEVKEAGSAEQVIQLLKDFKSETGFGGKETVQTQPKQNKLDAMRAVPSSPTRRPRSNDVDMNDIEAAWREANS